MSKVEKGWICLYRELLDKPIWLQATSDQKVILITLMLMVNHKSKKWKHGDVTYNLCAGQMITSVKSLVSKCCSTSITTQKVRTALKYFEDCDFLTIKTTNKNTLITIKNWDIYQNNAETNNKQNNKQITNKQQTNNKQITTNNNVNNDNNVNNNNIYIVVVDYLNQKANKAYKANISKTQRLINARLNEGYNVDDFKRVIDNKVKTWGKDKDMQKYLRPETLFGTKFESYLNEGNTTTSDLGYLMGGIDV